MQFEKRAQNCQETTDVVRGLAGLAMTGFLAG